MPAEADFTQADFLYVMPDFNCTDVTLADGDTGFLLIAITF